MLLAENVEWVEVLPQGQGGVLCHHMGVLVDQEVIASPRTGEGCTSSRIVMSWKTMKPPRISMTLNLQSSLGEGFSEHVCTAFIEKYMLMKISKYVRISYLHVTMKQLKFTVPIALILIALMVLPAPAQPQLIYENTGSASVEQVTLGNLGVAEFRVLTVNGSRVVLFLHPQRDIASQKMFDMLLHALSSKLQVQIVYDNYHYEIASVNMTAPPP
jgi:hypothetical protein